MRDFHHIGPMWVVYDQQVSSLYWSVLQGVVVISRYHDSCLHTALPVCSAFFFFFTEGQTPPLAVWLLKAHYDSITCPSLQQAHSRAKRAPFSCQGEGRRNEQQLWIETRRGSVVSGGERLSNCGLVKNLGARWLQVVSFFSKLQVVCNGETREIRVLAKNTLSH